MPAASLAPGRCLSREQGLPGKAFQLSSSPCTPPPPLYWIISVVPCPPKGGAWWAVNRSLWFPHTGFPPHPRTSPGCPLLHKFPSTNPGPTLALSTCSECFYHPGTQPQSRQASFWGVPLSLSPSEFQNTVSELALSTRASLTRSVWILDARLLHRAWTGFQPLKEGDPACRTPGHPSRGAGGFGSCSSFPPMLLNVNLLSCLGGGGKNETTEGRGQPLILKPDSE